MKKSIACLCILFVLCLAAACSAVATSGFAVSSSPCTSPVQDAIDAALVAAYEEHLNQGPPSGIPGIGGSVSAPELPSGEYDSTLYEFPRDEGASSESEEE